MPHEYKALELRAYVYDVLQGNISYNGSTVPVANRAFSGLSYPHILIMSNGFSEEGTKDFFGGNYSLVVEINNRFDINEGGQDGVDTITNSALNLLTLKGNSRRFGNSNMVALRYANDIVIEEEDERFYYVRRRITLEAIIHQDNQVEVLEGDILQGDLQLDLNG